MNDDGLPMTLARGWRRTEPEMYTHDVTGSARNQVRMQDSRAGVMFASWRRSSQTTNRHCLLRCFAEHIDAGASLR